MLKRFHARAKGAACASPSATATSWFKCPTASETRNGSKVNQSAFVSASRATGRRSGMPARRRSPRTSIPISGAQYLMKKLADASVSRIHIERAARRANITSTRRARAS